MTLTLVFVGILLRGSNLWSYITLILALMSSTLVMFILKSDLFPDLTGTALERTNTPEVVRHMCCHCLCFHSTKNIIQSHFIQVYHHSTSNSVISVSQVLAVKSDMRFAYEHFNMATKESNWYPALSSYFL